MTSLRKYALLFMFVNLLMPINVVLSEYTVVTFEIDTELAVDR